MAVLGSLRKNSFVLIAVIGMALFAFVIAGVFDGNSFQSQEPIGEINGESVSLTDFRRQVELYQKTYNFNDLQAITTAWDQSVRNELLSQEIEKLGIASGKDHLEFFLASNPNFNNDPRFPGSSSNRIATKPARASFRSSRFASSFNTSWVHSITADFIQ